MADRVTQVSAEIIGIATSKARVTQVSVEVIAVNPSGGDVPSHFRETQVTAEAIVQGPGNARTTQIAPEALIQTSPNVHLTQDTMDVLIRETPQPPFIPGGSLIGFTFNEEQGVTAWHRHPMIGAVESIACIPAPSKSQDDLWMIVNRTINGVTKRYIEYMAPHFVAGDDLADDALYSDCGKTYVGVPIQIVTGLGYLEGQIVKVLTDGSLHPDCVVTGGQITLQRKASVIQVGLPQTCRLTTMPIDIQSQGGSVAGKIKRVSDLSVRFANTVGGKIGIEDPDAELSDPPQTVMDDLEMREPADAMNGPVAVHNGLWPEETYGFNYPAGYEVEGRITYINEEPYPVTIVGIYPNVEVED